MSLIKLQGNASGTGALTIAAPNTNTDRTLTLPDATGTVNVSGLANEVPAGSAGAPAIYPTGDTNTGIFFPAADTIAFAEGGAEVARFNSSGNLGVGTTSPAPSTGASVDASGPHIARGFINDHQTSAAVFELNGNNASIRAYGATASSGFLTFKTGGGGGSADTERLRITATGLLQSPPTYSNTSGGAANVGIGGSGEFFRSTSSLKYKRDVQDATHGLTELMALRSVTYKGQAQSDGDTIYGGLIAEEVHDAGLTEFVQYAEDGSPDAISYGNMVSLCIKAIQEQQATITALEARITALEAN
jgi:hypothetical protein